MMRRGLTFSLRLGHAAALTAPRAVIHSRRAAALPSPHLSSADWFDGVLRRNSRLGRREKQSLHENLRFGAPGGRLGGVGIKAVSALSPRVRSVFSFSLLVLAFYFPARRRSRDAMGTSPRAEFWGCSAGRVADGGKTEVFFGIGGSLAARNVRLLPARSPRGGKLPGDGAEGESGGLPAARGGRGLVPPRGTEGAPDGFPLSQTGERGNVFGKPFPHPQKRKKRLPANGVRGKRAPRGGETPRASPPQLNRPYAAVRRWVRKYSSMREGFFRAGGRGEGRERRK